LQSKYREFAQTATVRTLPVETEVQSCTYMKVDNDINSVRCGSVNELKATLTHFWSHQRNYKQNSDGHGMV